MGAGFAGVSLAVAAAAVEAAGNIASGSGATFGREGSPSSSVTTLNASHSTLGSTFLRNSVFNSASTISSSASRGCKGNAAGSALHAFRAQVRKFRVRIFILVTSWWGEGG